MNKALVGLVVALVLAFGLLPGSTGRAASDPVQQVWVGNFPENQEIHGAVEVPRPIPHSAFVQREGVIVPPSRRNEPGELVAAGRVDTAGFTGIVLSLAGEMRDTYFAAGAVGVLLVPEEGPILEALRQEGRIELAAETVATIDPKAGGRFSSTPTTAPVAFPHYQIYLYNTSNKTAEANLYLYLTH